MQTRFTELVGCEVPLQLAVLGGGIGTPELGRAVAGAGGLGMIPGVDFTVDGLRAAFAGREGWPAAERNVGVGFLMPFVSREAVELAAHVAPVVEFFYGDPDPELVTLAKSGGAWGAWQVGSADEARAAVDAGCDFVVAQGIEAGGHVRGTLGVLTLLDAVLDAIDVPVLAAGGVGTPRGMAAALAAGADGVRVGTRFIVAAEASAHPDYRAALLDAKANDTVVTTAFGVFWPDAPHRVLRSCVNAATARGDESSGAFFADGNPVPLHAPSPPSGQIDGRVDALALYAGESVSAVTRVEPAAAIVGALVTGAEALLRDRAHVLLG